MPETQIVMHLCYSDFEDILPAIDGLDGAAVPVSCTSSEGQRSAN